ncbi:hypothetical protein PPACK8108_LOCUS7294 [Phakopsora pachyrhizi]|uniref:Uncharacterized protein n=1 Tax=Phakopsora pachyrhizi TaxID=170000 RepID=A0AAV0ASK2_PHAPC|nr:hypothetical protein PPACK8108_LOCUS7294 [Phakopsora pachyrhizi]
MSPPPGVPQRITDPISLMNSNPHLTQSIAQLRHIQDVLKNPNLPPSECENATLRGQELCDAVAALMDILLMNLIDKTREIKIDPLSSFINLRLASVTVSENQTILKYLRSLPRLKRRFRTKQKDKEYFLEDSGGSSDGSSETVKRSLVVPWLMVTVVSFQDERKNFLVELNEIKGLIQTISWIGQTAVDLLDNPSNLTVISPSLNRSLERWMMVSDSLSLLNCLIGYPITLFDRADVRRLDCWTRLEMI